MKRRSFIKGLLFSAMVPIAVACGVGRIESVAIKSFTYTHTTWVVDYDKLKVYKDGKLLTVNEDYYVGPE